MGCRGWRGTSHQQRKLVNAMKKYSDVEAADILAASRDTVSRLAKLREPEAPEAEFDAPLERWRSDGIERIERRARAYTERQINQLRGLLTAHFEERLASQTDATREFILEVVGQALGEFREMLIYDMSETYRDTFAKLSTSVDELRAQVSKLNNGKETAEPIDLPNPIAARRLQ